MSIHPDASNSLTDPSQAGYTQSSSRTKARQTKCFTSLWTIHDGKSLHDDACLSPLGVLIYAQLFPVPFPVARYLVSYRDPIRVHVSFKQRVMLLLLPNILYSQSAIEWTCFIVLNIGLEVTESLPGGTRAVAGLFQSFAVRASGFQIVSLSGVAPSFQYVLSHNPGSNYTHHA